VHDISPYLCVIYYCNCNILTQHQTKNKLLSVLLLDIKTYHPHDHDDDG
jgi:coproporphyrinogen III oxidase-like Fe-S oxidoreductase